MEAADQGAKPHLTMANEDYLECIVRIEAEGPDQGTDGIRSVEIAQRLDVSKAWVNKAIASLKSQGMGEQALRKGSPDRRGKVHGSRRVASPPYAARFPD